MLNRNKFIRVEKKSTKLNLLIGQAGFLALLSLILFLQAPSFGQQYLNNKIASDSLGNSYVAGNYTNSTLTFGDYNLKNNGQSDIFLAKYDSHGKIVWAENIGGSSNEKIISLSVNYNGNVTLSGTSNSKVINFPGGQLDNNGSQVTFSAEFSGDGNLLSSRIISTISKTVTPLYKTSGVDTSLSLISPKAGANWKVGARAEIQWSSSNVNSILIELSTDNGITWQSLDTTGQYDYSNEYTFLVPNKVSDSCLIKVSDFNNPSVSNTSGVFTISGKLKWKISQSKYNSVLRNVYFVNTNIGWAVGYNGLIKTTDEGKTWSPELTGYGLLDIFFLNQATASDNVGWTVGLNGTVFKTTDGGNNWTQLNTGFKFNFVKVYFADENNGYLLGNGSLLKTTDGGFTWNIIQPTEHVLQTMFFINKDTGWVAGNEGVILKTTDGGSNWVSQQVNGTDYGTLTSLYFVNENVGWASGSGLDVNGGVILKTTDGGNNWSMQLSNDTNTTTEGNRFIYSVSFSNPDSGWAVGDDGVMFNTTDGGINWVLQGSGTFADLYSVNANSGWSVGNDGVILRYADRLPSARSITGISNPVVPKGFDLSQNYPNPFNPSTVINYQLTTSSHVTLKVYDILGREVATLVNQEKPAGNYEVRFNANNLASGTYIYRLVAGSIVQTKKMILLK